VTTRSWLLLLLLVVVGLLLLLLLLVVVGLLLLLLLVEVVVVLRTLPEHQQRQLLDSDKASRSASTVLCHEAVKELSCCTGSQQRTPGWRNSCWTCSHN
jgi:hypothetical protein